MFSYDLFYNDINNLKAHSVRVTKSSLRLWRTAQNLHPASRQYFLSVSAVYFELNQSALSFSL